MSSQLERPTRLYSAADRQTECWSRSCWSIDHTEVYASGATKTIHRYAIRLSHDRAVQYCTCGGLVHPSFPLPNACHSRKRKTDQKEKRTVILPSGVSINQWILGVHSIKLQDHVLKAAASKRKSLQLTMLIDPWKIAAMVKADYFGGRSWENGIYHTYHKNRCVSKQRMLERGGGTGAYELVTLCSHLSYSTNPSYQ